MMVHDYHLYTLPGDGPRGPPGRLPAPLRPHPVDPAGRLARAARRRSARRSTTALLANDIIGFHTRSYRRNFLQCCRDLMDLEVDFEEGIVHVRRPRGLGARLPAADRLRGHPRRRPPPARARVRGAACWRRRREYSILRVDRADLSKNVLRGFTAFDIFLEQHPEFAERITFTAQLMPSRTDVPEYAEYLEKIEALVAVVNHRHGTPDWMPIDLKLRDDLDEAVASYKHYDVMMVNAMFDGMNLVAKEGPLVNERHGVSILSENTGAHEELGEFALSVNPFDVQELADAIYSALTMSPEARERRARGLKEIVTSRDPGDWIDEQIADIRAKAGAPAPRAPLSAAPSNPNSTAGVRRAARRAPRGARGAARAAPARGAVGVAAAPAPRAAASLRARRPLAAPPVAPRRRVRATAARVAARRRPRPALAGRARRASPPPRPAPSLRAAAAAVAAAPPPLRRSRRSPLARRALAPPRRARSRRPPRAGARHAPPAPAVSAAPPAGAGASGGRRAAGGGEQRPGDDRGQARRATAPARATLPHRTRRRRSRRMLSRSAAAGRIRPTLLPSGGRNGEWTAHLRPHAAARPGR